MAFLAVKIMSELVVCPRLFEVGHDIGGIEVGPDVELLLWL